ncbi:MAG: hypothetical protein SFY66_09670 [Oculatellaceae cyanobacterium bins.114]|nr:hypothetical protein [Oculatellaceae cyanobacterium bins.114]
MSDNLSLTKKLDAYRRLQMKHDEIFHFEILALGVSRRMSHIALHLIKYLRPLSSLPVSAPENKRALVDAFIMVISASNLLGVSLSVDPISNEDINPDKSFINTYVQFLADLAKSCEAADHQEDYPIRATWNKAIQQLFFLLSKEAAARNINILEEAACRLTSVEKSNSLNYILSEK